VAQEGGLVLRHVDALEPEGHLVRAPLLDRNAVQRLQQLPVVAAPDLRLLVALHQVEAAPLLEVQVVRRLVRVDRELEEPAALVQLLHRDLEIGHCRLDLLDHFRVHGQLGRLLVDEEARLHVQCPYAIEEVGDLSHN